MAVLTIARQHGSGGMIIGRAVAQRLGYELVEKNRIFEDLKRRGQTWGRLDEEMRDKTPRLWERHDNRYNTYLAMVESVIFDYAATGRAVIVGRGSSFVLAEAPLCLRVRLLAPFHERVRRIMEWDGFSEQREAEKVVSEMDEDRRGYNKANYRGCEDASCFDINYNTGERPLEEITDELVAKLLEIDKEANQDDWDILRGLALAARLKAYILGRDMPLQPTLDVTYQITGILVKATVHRPEQAQRIEETTQELCGHTPYRLDLRTRL